MQFSFSDNFRRRVLVASCAASLASTLFAAVPARADDEGSGPPVARLHTVEGDIDVRRADSNEDLAGAINAPLLAGDSVTSSDGSRAEIALDGYSFVRIGGNAQVRFVDLRPRLRELQVAGGSVDVDEMRARADVPQIDTPTVSFRPHAAGRYRVDVDRAGTTRLTVRVGSADVTTPGGVLRLIPGTTLVASGSPTLPQLAYVAAEPSDAFDAYNAERDRRIAAEIEAAADASVYGGDDLSAYGRWVEVPRYGRVWSPYEAADWAPYRVGRWVWEDAYGWTWVASEPWGWAPYHYGRWLNAPGYGWCWYPPAPSPVLVQTWRPALVAFIGFGLGSSGVAFGVGNVGWVPLAPFEPYRPWYGANGASGYAPTYTNVGHVGPTYTTVNRVTNITNVTNVNVNSVHNTSANGNIIRSYSNARYAGGITAVRAAAFAAGGLGQRVALTPSDLRHVTDLHGAVPIAPRRTAGFAVAHHAPERARPQAEAWRRPFAGRPYLGLRTLPVENARPRPVMPRIDVPRATLRPGLKGSERKNPIVRVDPPHPFRPGILPRFTTAHVARRSNESHPVRHPENAAATQHRIAPPARAHSDVHERR